jgi:nucleoside-diphosphate-sugar epimerase
VARILVLGGTGFLGAHVVRLLSERGHTVCVFNRGQTKAELPASVQHVQGDFATFPDRLQELRRYAPDVVIDTVPYHDKDGHGVRHFAGVARRAVVITSGDVYRAFARGWGTEPGPPDPVPLTEDAPLRDKPSPDFGEEIDFDNVDVERAVRSSTELPTTILRIAAIYGPGDPLHRLYRYVKRMDDDRPAIILDARLAQWRFSRCYVVNAAQAVALAAVTDRAAGRTYNVAPAYTATEAEWVRSIAEAHGWSGEIVSIAREQLPEQLRVLFNTDHHLALDSNRIRAELWYTELISTREALRDTIEWERRNPPSSPPAFDYDAEGEVLGTIR